MTIDDAIAYLQAARDLMGGQAQIVLWDLDTSSYFQMTAKNFEVQKIGDRFRLSVGPNSWGDPTAEYPTERPIVL